MTTNGYDTTALDETAFASSLAAFTASLRFAAPATDSSSKNSSRTSPQHSVSSVLHSTEFIPAQPSFLVLTQNVSALLAAGSSVTAQTATPSPPSSSVCNNTAKARTDAFVADVRGWLHRMAWQHGKMQRTNVQVDACQADMQGEGSGMLTSRTRHEDAVLPVQAHSHSEDRLGGRATTIEEQCNPQQQRIQEKSSSNRNHSTEDNEEESTDIHCATAAAASASSVYSLHCTPDLFDVVVIHLQSVHCHIDDKRNTQEKHRQHSEEVPSSIGHYLADALQHKLLPEAGWTSGLLHAQGHRCTHALCGVASIVFLSTRMCAISSMLSIPHRTYIPVNDDPLSYGSCPTHVYHARSFHRAQQPKQQDEEYDASHAGFLLFSLRLGTTAVHFCNLHLPADRDNVLALAHSPSVYASARREAFLETVAETLSLAHHNDAIFFAGDFNTRLDGCALVKRLREVLKVRIRPTRGSLRCPASFWRLFESKRGSSHATENESSSLSWEVMHRDLDSEPHAMLSLLDEQSGMALAEMPITFAPTFKHRAVRWAGLYSKLVDSQSTFDTKDHAENEEAVPVRDVCDGMYTTAEASCADTHDAMAKVTESDDALPKLTAVQRDDTHMLDAFAESFLMRQRDTQPFRHDRLPAWTDRVFFNHAALAFMMRGLRTSNTTQTDSYARHEKEQRATATRKSHRDRSCVIKCHTYTRHGKMSSDGGTHRYSMRSSYVDVNEDEEDLYSSSSSSSSTSSDLSWYGGADDRHGCDDEAGNVAFRGGDSRTHGHSTSTHRAYRWDVDSARQNMPNSEPLAAALAALEKMYEQRCCIYDAVSFVHMDHDGVFLTF